ncbi:hypothetical protein GWK47_041253 [Chionoecetes opilio]|uniref:Uncharacterized protein n=1 Tax=Chionoecetes opilio TaxID=41210 RepID=A0A8J4YA11_CHIOP|nr:hypothetical protein GWK47_041253 [Chionoecetes opilio]
MAWRPWRWSCTWEDSELTVVTTCTEPATPTGGRGAATMASAPSLLVSGDFNAQAPHPAVSVGQPTLTVVTVSSVCSRRSLTSISSTPRAPPVGGGDWNPHLGVGIGTSRQPFRGQPTQPFLSASPGRRHRPRLVVLQRRTSGSTNHRVNLHKSCNKRPAQPHQPAAVAGGLHGGPEGNGLELCASFNQHTSSASCEECPGRLPVPPPPRPPPTHTHTEMRRGLHRRVFTARGSSAQLPPRTRPSSKTASTTPRRGCQGGAGGNLTWLTHLFTRQELSAARKKARHSCRDGRRDILHAGSGRACRGPALLAHAQRGLGWQATCHQRGRSRYSAHLQPGAHQTQALSPSSAARLKQPEKNGALGRLQWPRGSPPTSRVLASPARRGPADSLLTLLSGQQLLPITVLLDLDKRLSWPSSRYSRQPSRGRGSGDDCFAWLEDYLQHRRARVSSRPQIPLK